VAKAKDLVINIKPVPAPTPDDRPTRIYLASSWRNGHQPFMVKLLREAGFEVYDFRQPQEGNPEGGFRWSDVNPGWENATPEEFKEMLRHPVALDGFERDMAALVECDICVLLMPCGRSAHLELGWAIGHGIPSCVTILDKCEPELMYHMADAIHTSFLQTIKWCEDKRMELYLQRTSSQKESLQVDWGAQEARVVNEAVSGGESPRFVGPPLRFEFNKNDVPVNPLRRMKAYDHASSSLMSNARWYYRQNLDVLVDLQRYRDALYIATRQPATSQETAHALYGDFAAEYNRLAEQTSETDRDGMTMYRHFTDQDHRLGAQLMMTRPSPVPLY
jgi:nucleoside 2-deoxyribosyltransferase